MTARAGCVPLVRESFEPIVGVAASDSEGRPRKQADVLVDIGRHHLLFRDPSGVTYAQVSVKGHAEVFPIESCAYREVLAERFLRVAGKGCNRNSLGDAVVTLGSIARFDGKTHPVAVRVAGVGEAIVIDMGKSDWTCIEVTGSGWTWCDAPPKFRRAGAPLALPDPATPDFGRLWKYANVHADDRPLLAGFMLAALRPTGPYPQLHLSGEQGTGKSTLARLIKRLLDPSASPLRAPPKELRDLLVGAHNGWCLALDNLSSLTPQLSDALCRLSTGGAISERQLYTNAEEVLIEVQRPVILNGIEDLAVRPDLAERGLHLELEVVQQRMSEAALWKEFDADAPYIFAALLVGISLAIRDHQSINIGHLPRMADFAQWAAAGLPALGFSAEEFMWAYRHNIGTGLSAGIESSLIGRSIRTLMMSLSNWTGSASELLEVLSRTVDESAARSPSWPRSAQALSGAIKRLAPALRSSGVDVISSRNAYARTLTLCRRPNHPSLSSISSLPSASPEVNDVNDGYDDQSVAAHRMRAVDDASATNTHARRLHASDQAVTQAPALTASDVLYPATEMHT